MTEDIYDPFYARLAFAFGLSMMAAILLSGCKEPFSVESRPSAVDGGRVEAAVLTPTEQRHIRQTLHEVAGSHQLAADRSPRPIEWEDVRGVVNAACAELEMAVARVRAIDDNARVYHIRTIDDRPAELLVTRRIAADGRAAQYDAAATVGLFRDDVDRAENLVHRFDVELNRLRQRRIAEVQSP